MSLINQMLRDLEQRKPAKPQDQVLAPQVLLTPRRDNRRGLWLLALPPLIAAYLELYQDESKPTQVAPPTPAAVIPNNRDIAEHPNNLVSPAISGAEAHSGRQTLELSAPPVTAIEPNPPVADVSATVPTPTPTVQSVEPDIKPVVHKPSKPAAQAPHQPTSLPAQTQGERAEALYRQAQQASSAAMAKNYLSQALALNPYHRAARALLLQNLLTARAANSELSQFVNESLSLFPDDPLFIKTQAHIYVEQKNFEAAATLLETLPPGTNADPASLSLLAASYQQLERFSQAEHIYLQLTQLQAEKAAHWLGLAICQDKLNQPEAAARAYQEALDKNSLNPEVVDYIKQRLSALN